MFIFNIRTYGKSLPEVRVSVTVRVKVKKKELWSVCSCCRLIPFLLILLSRDMKTRLLTDALFGRVSNSYQVPLQGLSYLQLSPQILFLERSGGSAVRSWAKWVIKQPYILKFISFPSRLHGLTAGCAPVAPTMERCLGARRLSIGFSYNTLTRSWLLSSLLSLTLHLYYFVRVLSSIILIFYRSEA